MKPRIFYSIAVCVAVCVPSTHIDKENIYNYLISSALELSFRLCEQLLAGVRESDRDSVNAIPTLFALQNLYGRRVRVAELPCEFVYM